MSEPLVHSPALSLPKGPPDAIGLYDPSQEHDACGVGFIVDIKGRRSHAVVRKGLRAAHQPAAPRRVRLRGEHRRRRRHHHSDPGQVPAQGGGAAGHHAASRRSVRDRPGVPAAAGRGARAGQGARRARRLGGRAARARVANRADGRRGHRRLRAGDQAGHRADLHRRRRTGPGQRRTRPERPRRPDARSDAVREKAVRHSQARRARGRRARHDRTARVLPAEPVVADDDLQGHAQSPIRSRGRFPICPIPISSRRWRSSTSASARTRSRRGRSRTRIATSRTTARSTRCAATSTGCAPARGCSARICSATI